MNNQTLSLIACILSCIATTTFFFAIIALSSEHYGHLGLIGVNVLTIGVVIIWSMYTNCEDSSKCMTYSLVSEVITK